MSSKSPLIVFSHLRWNFVYQRPQHVVSRLALRRPVLFIEEPIEDVESISPRWERSEVAPNVSVLVPRIPRTQAPLNFGHPAVKHLVHRLCILESINKPTVWTYTPSAVELIESLDYSQLIYDCMDELSAFLHAPPELVEQERKLMRLATMVFTGGPSLFRSKRDLHPEVYCFPSSVDIRHFQDGTLNLPEAAVQVNLPSPPTGILRRNR